jgi:hypothetical protein
MMPDSELSHFDPLIAALVANGNRAIDTGFVPSQAGWMCHFDSPLDAEVVRNFIAADERDVVYVEADDMVHCPDCWGAVIGGRA